MSKPRMSRYRVLPVLLMALGLYSCTEEPVQEKEQIRPVRAIQVSVQAQGSGRSFPGTAKATQEVDLSFRVGGPLITFPVNIGDRVKTGDVLASIDPRDYEVELDNAQGQLNRAEANAKRAQADYDRELNILAQDAGATSQAAVDRKEANRDQARAEIRSLKASVSAAKDKLRYTKLKAPYDGVVVNTFVENFETVLPRKKIVRVLDDSWIEMIVNIPENLISLVPDVKDIRVRFDSYPDHSLEATVKEIGKEASKTTRTYPVTLIMEQPEDIKILPGMAGTATGTLPVSGTDDQSEKPVVPIGAVFTPDTQKQDHVWVIDEKSGGVELRVVKTGNLTPSGIQVIDGLEIGEWIAIAGVHTLREGQKVRIDSTIIKE
ncbi:MAG: efflux RND transporter periplasmic adaptor subunit [Gammaproteobacteria bacterium]|nr:MAG: efflux RND transporter periplasmic adaptor subunit [Gammaproteobacteria bacterium]